MVKVSLKLVNAMIPSSLTLHLFFPLTFWRLLGVALMLNKLMILPFEYQIIMTLLRLIKKSHTKSLN